MKLRGIPKEVRCWEENFLVPTVSFPSQLDLGHIGKFVAEGASNP
jgi:hypothetical protein